MPWHPRGTRALLCRETLPFVSFALRFFFLPQMCRLTDRKGTEASAQILSARRSHGQGPEGKDRSGRSGKGMGWLQFPNSRRFPPKLRPDIARPCYHVNVTRRRVHSHQPRCRFKFQLPPPVFYFCHARIRSCLRRSFTSAGRSQTRHTHAALLT